MGNEDRPNITLDGDVSPFRQKLREAAADLKRFGSDGETAIGRMSGPLGALQSKFVAVGAILAGGAVFKEAVRQAAEFTEQSMKLGAALGVSATEASTYIAALEDIDVSQEEFIGAVKAMTKEIKNNEDGLQAMGLKTRDAAGNLRPLNELTVEGIAIVKGYKEGTDRAIAGQTMFGKSFQLTGNLLKLNSDALEENKKLQQELGAIVGGENVAAWEAYDSAGDKSHLTMKAMQTTVGNALIPALTDLGNWFVAIGPAAVTVIKGAIGGLVSTFHLVTTGVTVLWETLNAMVVSVAEPIRALGEAIGKALDGDWAGARAAVGNIGANIGAAWGKAFDEMVAKAQTTRDKIHNLFAEGTPSAAPDGGGKSAAGLVKPGDKEKKAKADKAPDSYMQYYEAALAEEKNLFEQENVLRQYSKEQELAYWRDRIGRAELTEKDRVAIAKRTSALELDIRRQSAKDERELEAVNIDARKAAALAQIEIDEQQANIARENGEITKLQLIELEERFAASRNEIERKAMQDRLDLASTDPTSSPAALQQIREQMLQVDRAYQLRKNQLEQDKKKEKGSFGSMFDDAGQAFGNMARNLLTSATTLRAQLAQVFQSIYQSFIVNLVTKPFGEWLASQARMLAIKMGFLTQETTMETTAAVTQGVAQHAAGITGVMSNSAIAATGAMASVAAIPFVGWSMAPEVGAATYATGMAYLASARNGYDIPKGLNPIVQTHEEEMILPKAHANVIRGLADSGQSKGSAGATVNVNVTAMDSQSVIRALTKGGALQKTLRELGRNFTPVKPS